jgi:hypothetical protein
MKNDKMKELKGTKKKKKDNYRHTFLPILPVMILILASL